MSPVSYYIILTDFLSPIAEYEAVRKDNIAAKSLNEKLSWL
jgi:hypothetical protein